MRRILSAIVLLLALTASVQAPILNPLFQGVAQEFYVTGTPRIIRGQILYIRLDTPGLRLFVSPGTPVSGYDTTARTTGEALELYGLSVAINGDCCQPWWDKGGGSGDYYPHSGDGVNFGDLAVSGGVVYHPDGPQINLYIDDLGKVYFDTPPLSPRQTIYAVMGQRMLIRDGQVLVADDTNWHPRTAVALSQDGKTLLLVVMDGRQAWHSYGVSYYELAQIILAHGGWTAMALDGGGTTTMVRNLNGKAVLMNSPIHNGVPMTQRPLASVVGVYAPPLLGK